MSKIRLGIIGAGGIAARLHLPELQPLADDFEVVLISGRRQSRLELLCERFDIPRWTQSYEDVVADDGVDAIIVATPHTHHVSWCIAAVEAGKHVLVQKPLCDNMEEADALVEAVERTGRVALCMPHFSPAIYTIRERIQRGDIGKVSGAQCRHSHGGPEVYYAEIRDIFGEQGDDLWFFDAKQASVGALFDMGVYATASLVAMVGSARRVTGFVSTVDKPTELEDTATLLLQLENGAICTAETGWCDPARTSMLRVHGTAGKLTMPGEEGATVSLWTPTSSTREYAPPKIEAVECTAGVGDLHSHFRDCIREDRQPPMSHVYAARHVTEILLAGLESSRTGQAVELTTRADG